MAAAAGRQARCSALLIDIVGYSPPSPSDSFLTESNFTNLLRQMVTTGLLALGMLVVILTGGILGIVITRRKVRARLARQGVVVPPLRSAIARNRARRR